MLTVPEAAKEGNVTAASIYTAIYRHILPAQESYGRVLIERQELQNYLASKKKKGRPIGSTKKKQTGEASEPNTDTTQH